MILALGILVLNPPAQDPDWKWRSRNSSIVGLARHTTRKYLITFIDMLSPPLSLLDSTLYDLGCDDSGPHSSHPKAETATDDSGHIELQRYLDSPRSSPSLTSHSTSTASSSSSYLSPLSSGYLSTPAPAFSPFPGLSPEILNGEWGDNDARIRESPEPYECSQPESALSGASTVAMRYVPPRPNVHIASSKPLVLSFSSP